MEKAYTLMTGVIGRGSEDDPIRVPFPTYVLLDIDPTYQWAIIRTFDWVYEHELTGEEIEVEGTDGKRWRILIPDQKTIAELEAKERERFPHLAQERRLRDVLRRRG